MGWPAASDVSATSPDAATALPARRMARTGAMVKKMAANSIPTSRIAPQSKPLASCSARGVIRAEKAAMARNTPMAASFSPPP